MDWNKDFSSDSQKTAIIAEYNEAISNIILPEPDRVSVMTLDEQANAMILANHAKLRAAIRAMSRLTDPEQMPDATDEMKVHRCIAADRLWHHSVETFRFMVNLLSLQYASPEAFENHLKKQ